MFDKPESLALALCLLITTSCTVGEDIVDVLDDEPGENPNAEPPAEGPSIVHSIQNGSFHPLAEFAQMPIDGRVQMTRLQSGVTQIDLVATGLVPNTEHAVHLHALPCEFNAGPHYKIDPAIAETLEANEIWPTFTTDPDGIGRAQVSVSHLARADAMSVVIHAPVGGKMACADLFADDDGVYASAGDIGPLPDVEPLDQTIRGSVSLATTGISTNITMSIAGLDPASIYTSHVHALPCEVLAGGAHYMIDPLAAPADPAAIEANELWPVIGEHAAGSATVNLTRAHSARYDAASIVIHRVIDAATVPKVACANLMRAKYPAGMTSGSAVLLDAGHARTANLTASAELVRRLDGVTIVSMNAIGLAAGGSYAVHVHNLPCAVKDGGGHYVIEGTVSEVLPENEIWLRLTGGADTAASARNFARHIARSDATSLVIHDQADGARLACLDLQ